MTRPAAQAAPWVQELRLRGVEAVELPLIGIEPVSDRAAVEAAWAALARRRLVVFVSPNAAQQFFACRPAGAAWPASVLAASPGPGTTRSLVSAGIAAAQIIEPAADAAQFDSEALWAQLGTRDWRGADVLILRGERGREWLAETLRRHGAQVDELPVYRRVAPAFSAPQRELLARAIAAPDAFLWLFSSSVSLDHLAALVPAAGAACAADPRWSRSRALATHPRIAQRARDLGFGRVFEARPELAAVVACIQSIRS